jgi:uncharacterized SAM-binding protein YcdF (DUF218 family)
VSERRPGVHRISDEQLALAERLWDYHQLHHEPAPADVILVLCSHDTIVAERGAELYLQGLAPLLVFSGGRGKITSRFFAEPEAELFARIACERGVPAAAILTETRSTNTGENVAFSRALLGERGFAPERVLLVQKPYMERRAYATFERVWPGKQVQVTSPRVSFRDYLFRGTHDRLSPEDVVGIMVGDLQRIREYPALGFQVPQEIPDDVWAAYEALVAAGFDGFLIA